MNYKSRNQPLKCAIVDNQLIISVGINTISYVANKKEYFTYAPHEKERHLKINVTNKNKLAKEFLAKLEEEEKADGDTYINVFLDKILDAIIEDGSENVEYLEEKN